MAVNIAQALEAHAVGQGVQGLGDPASRAVLYLANQMIPNVIPDPEAFVKSWYSKFTSADLANFYLGAHGLVASKEPWYGYTITLRAGLYRAEYNKTPDNPTALQIASASRQWFPSLQELMEMNARGIIDPTAANIWFHAHGVPPDDARRLLARMFMQIPPPQDLIRFAVREVFNDQQRQFLKLDEEFDQNTEYQEWARAQGIGETTMRASNGQIIRRNFAQDYWAAHWQLPSPGQGYEFLYRLRPDRIAKWQLDVPGVQPFTMADLRTLLKAQDYSPAWRDALAATSFRLPGRIDLRRMFFARLIDRKELYESFLDLGYGTVDAGRQADLVQWMRDNRLTRFDLDRLLRRGIIGQPEYLRRMGQQGYSDADALLMARGNERMPTPAQVIRWYKKNILTRVQAIDKLTRLGYDPLDAQQYIDEVDTDRKRRQNAPAIAKITEAWRIGAIMTDRAKELLTRLGLSAIEVDALAADQNAQTRIDSVRAALRRIRRQYLSGYITTQIAREQLGTMGITDSMREIYLARWEAELGPDRRELSAQQVVDALKRGLISVSEARRRLSILGYDEQTGSILLLAAEQDRQTAAARAAIAASRTVKEQQAAAKAAIRESDAAKRRAVADLARHGSPSTLMRWVQRNIISVDQAAARLAELYWPERDINAWRVEALQKRHEWLSKGAKAATSEVQPPVPINLTHPGGPVL